MWSRQQKNPSPGYVEVWAHHLCPKNSDNQDRNISVAGNSVCLTLCFWFAPRSQQFLLRFSVNRNQGHRAQLESNWVKTYTRQNHFLAAWHLLHARLYVCTARLRCVSLRGTECVGSRRRWYQPCQCEFDCSVKGGARGDVSRPESQQTFAESPPTAALIITWVHELSSNAQRWYFPDNLTFSEWAPRMGITAI